MNERTEMAIDHGGLTVLIEALMKRSLNPIQEARMVEQVFPSGRYSSRDVSRQICRSPAWVSSRRNLLRLSEDEQRLVAERRLPVRRVKALLASPVRTAAVTELLKRGSLHEACPELKCRRKTEITSLIKRLEDAGIHGLSTRVLGWAAGLVTTGEIDFAIDEYVKEGVV